ncbi:hypothetical protein PAXRUDRAFT_824440 [Paxillus rubicundulus Ve08.2h10]|uniref:Uncharacterized protein n=1 Tax=Paxillus rubicundulus Ve08.2h10 TaxID=930991 RepID=A0A0D0DUH2_9AGAM|nr:hypothetical protein PAXRUDRAFT_824440 [Paxillus rubicundulus Ve08.2h10]
MEVGAEGNIAHKVRPALPTTQDSCQVTGGDNSLRGTIESTTSDLPQTVMFLSSPSCCVLVA